MQKPELRIAHYVPSEYDLSERVVRQLQDSPLHVLHASVFSSVPAEIGDPNDPLTSIEVILTLVTDGRRGWLLLVSEQDEYDVVKGMTELIGGLVQDVSPQHFVLRTATKFYPPEQSETLDLREREQVCRIVEDAFETAMGTNGETDVEAFLEPFYAYNYRVLDELTLRKYVSDNDPEELRPRVSA